MELYFGEYQHVQQEYGVHLRLASDEAPKPRNSQPSKAGSYGVSIRVQGIDGHPYIVLNNTERCLAGTPFPENVPAFPSSMINNLSLHPSNGTALKENNPEELQLSENPYLQTSPIRNQKQSPLHEGRNGVVEHKDRPTKLPHVLNFQRHPEILQPYDPEKNEVTSKKHHPPESPWLRNAAEEGTNYKKPRNCFPKPCSSQPNSPPLEDVAKANTTAIRLCSSVVIEDPQKQTSVCVNVQSCAKEGLGEEALSPRRKSPTAPGPQAYSETKKSRPDVLPFRRQDSAGPILDGARSRRSSSSSTTPTSATSLYRFLLDDQECAIHADNVNRHENRRYIPFLPGTGRDIDTCSIPGVDQLIEKFDQKPGLQRRGRSGKRNRINPDDRKRSRSVDSAFPFGLQGNTEYLTEFSRNLGKSSEHLLRPSQVFPQRSLAPEHRGKHSPSCTLAKPQGTTQSAHPKPPLQNKDGKVLNKGSQESVVACASSLPAQNKKEEEIKIATATLMLQNRAVAATPDSGAKKISVKTFPSDSNTQATPDLLKGQQELSQQTNEETAKQILYNYLKEGSTDNEDATKRKVNLVFEKIQTLKSRAAGSAQGNNQASSFNSEVKDLLEQKNKLISEVSELQRQLQLEMKNHQNIKEERERMREDLEELRGRHQSQVEETATLQRRLEESEGELRKNLEELFQVKMEREQHQTEIRDLQDQLSEMHDELDSTKQSEDREKGALIEELLQAKRDLQDLLIAKEEQEDLLRKRERELTALKGALKEEVSSHDQEMDRLKEQYDAELQALRESVEEATKMSDIAEASRTSSLQLQRQLGEYKEKNRRELAEMQTQLKEKSLEVEKARLAAVKMQDELRLKEEELRDYQRAENEALTKRQLLEQSLKDLEYELEAKSHLKDDRSRLIKQMEDKVSQLEVELEEERTNADLLSERITWSREQMEQMRSELLQEKAAKQDLECDKISLERQNKDLKSRIIHLEGSYRSSKEGLVVQMEARIAELEDQLENEERDRANLQLNNRRLERKVKELVMQVDDEHLSLTDQKDQLSLRLKAMKRQVEEAEEEIDRLESSKKKLQRELEDQIGVNEQLQGQLNSMKKGLRLKTLPSKVLDDSDDDDLSSDGGSLYEAPLSYSFPKDSTLTSQI
ncbi:Cgnl1 [Phodopus roborovskii]|uniref:Cgnl1 protein n=1 Tax=Phodopus roborovskii TaxID=109678 RepID=A0AAU9ZVY1_PHORO|nr:Cgnl1 [Phodopus roborovskii]